MVLQVLRRSEADQKRKVNYLLFLSWVAIPFLLVYAAFNFMVAREASMVNLMLAGLMAVNIVFLNSGVRWYRQIVPDLTVVLVAIALIYFVYAGTGGGASLLWTYVFPMIALFVMGGLRGLLISLIVLGATAWLILHGSEAGGYEYGGLYFSRFTGSFLMVTLFAFAYEFWRAGAEIEREMIAGELIQTREELDTISSLVNVCAWCKKIKNDEGYWDRVEEYLSTREEVLVSHAICPECAARAKTEMTGS